MIVRSANDSEVRAVRQFLARSSWAFTSFGDEDLPLYLAGGDGYHAWLAEDGRKPLGFLALSLRRTAWADVRGVALAQTHSDVAKAMVGTAREAIAAQGGQGLMCVATASWLPRVLNAAGFKVVDHIVTYQRPLADFAAPYLPDDVCCVVPTGGQALDAILAVDGAAFQSMWQMERREMLTYLLTASHTTVAQCDDRIAGYAVTHVHGREGQVIRLAVHPQYQRQGLGRQLLADALHYCQVKGAQRATLNTQESNDVSQRLYRSTEFRPVGKAIPVLVHPL